MKDMCSGYRVGALLVDDEQEFEAIFREALEKVTGQLSFPIRLSYSKDMAEAVEKEEAFDIYSCGQRAKRACLHAHLATAAGVNTPQLCCVASLMPRQLAAGLLTFLKSH